MEYYMKSLIGNYNAIILHVYTLNIEVYSFLYAHLYNHNQQQTKVSLKIESQASKHYYVR